MPVPSQTRTGRLGKKKFDIDLDSGATVSFLRLDVAERLNLKLLPNVQLALLADKVSQMKSLGEVNIEIIEMQSEHIILRLRALVVKTLGVECYGGQTFHLDNGIVDNVSQENISFHNGRFKISQKDKYGKLVAYPPPCYSTKGEDNHQSLAGLNNIVSGDNNYTISDMGQKTISIKHPKSLLPAGSYGIDIGSDAHKSILIMPEPPKLPAETFGTESPSWPPQICNVEQGVAQYVNNSIGPLYHQKNVHFTAVPVKEISMDQAQAVKHSKVQLNSVTAGMSRTKCMELLAEVKVNKKNMSAHQLKRLENIHMVNIRAFDDDLSDGYCDESNPYEASFSFKKENKAPPVKVWVPQFNRKCQDLLQAKCDELETQGVLLDPKKNNIDIRHVSPCFIQQKARAKHKPLDKCDLSEVRFITCYNVLNDSIQPVYNVSKTYNDILKFMARHKFLIFADLLNSYFQVKVKKKLWKYLAVMTPHRGLRVMTRCGQGLLNSNVELDQVLCRVLGDEISAGICLQARDDIFVGGDTMDDALTNWETILSKLANANLKVTARKVRIFLGDS